MVVWGHQLVGHVGVFDFLFVRLRYFVVQDLVRQHTALYLHSQEGGSMRPDNFSQHLVLHGFDPGSIAINFVDDHLVSVAAA